MVAGPRNQVGLTGGRRGGVSAPRSCRPDISQQGWRCRKLHALAPPSACIEVRANPGCRVHNSQGDFWHALDPVPKDTAVAARRFVVPCPPSAKEFPGVVGYRSMDRRCVSFTSSGSASIHLLQRSSTRHAGSAFRCQFGRGTLKRSSSSPLEIQPSEAAASLVAG